MQQDDQRHGAGGRSPAEEHAAGSEASYSYGTSPLSPGSAASGSVPEGAPQDASTEARMADDPTAARATVRPVPDGVAPPPRRTSRRTPVMIALAIGLVLLVVVMAAVGVLAVRSMLPAGDDDGPDDQPAASAPPGPASTQIGASTVTLDSVETGLDAVGEKNERVEADGSFVIVTVTIENGGTDPMILTDPMTLVLSDGEEVSPDRRAGLVAIADTESSAVLPAGQSVTLHAVFDAPLGSEPTEVNVDLGSADDAGEGTLSLEN